MSNQESHWTQLTKRAKGTARNILFTAAPIIGGAMTTTSCDSGVHTVTILGEEPDSEIKRAFRYLEKPVFTELDGVIQEIIKVAQGGHYTFPEKKDPVFYIGEAKKSFKKQKADWVIKHLEKALAATSQLDGDEQKFAERITDPLRKTILKMKNVIAFGRAGITNDFGNYVVLDEITPQIAQESIIRDLKEVRSEVKHFQKHWPNEIRVPETFLPNLDEAMRLTAKGTLEDYQFALTLLDNKHYPIETADDDRFSRFGVKYPLERVKIALQGLISLESPSKTAANSR